MLPHDVMPLAPAPQWPLALGWWLLITIVVGLVAGLVWLIISWRQRHRDVRLLQRHWQRQTQHANPEQVRQMSESIKRLLISRHGRTNVAALSDKAWLQYLDALVELPILQDHLQHWQQVMYNHDATEAHCQVLQQALITWLNHYAKQGGKG